MPREHAFRQQPECPLEPDAYPQLPSGTVTRAVYGLGLLYEETGSAVRYYHYDYRGSAVAFTDAYWQLWASSNQGRTGELSVLSGDTRPRFCSMAGTE